MGKIDLNMSEKCAPAALGHLRRRQRYNYLFRNMA